MPKSKTRKNKFIDKKNAVTFHLVHRSQQDPLICDETAPQHVLVEAPARRKDLAKQQKDEVDKKITDPKKRLEEQKKFGIFFDDEYDYLQHLRAPAPLEWEYVPQPNRKDRTDEVKKPSIMLPSSVFASEVEEDVGMLSRLPPTKGPRPDLDPDLVAALDDDFDFENPDNQIDDDFVSKAMLDVLEEGEEDGSDVDSEFSGYSDEERDCVGEMGEGMFRDCETKSRFTEYSMSSSVIRRNEQLSLLDDRFEKFFENYDDQELGPVELENIEGYVDVKDELVMRCVEDWKKERDAQYENYNKEWDSDRIKKFIVAVDSDEELVEMEVEDDKSKKWDAESILSTYSNIYNHPKRIQEPKKAKIIIDPKTGIPTNVFRGDNGKLTASALSQLNSENTMGVNAKSAAPKSLCDKSVISTLSVLSIRPKDETIEEKHERKSLLKEYRRQRRVEKKANTDAFKEETKRQIQITLNNKNNLQGKRIL